MSAVRTALLVFFFLCFSASSRASNDETITIIVNDWASQIVLSHLVGNLIRYQGHPIQFLKSTTDGQWYDLKSKKAHIQMEVWQGTMEDKYLQMKQAGWLVDAGTYSAITREDWWFPAYVKTLCPELPDWRALGKCYQLFAQSEHSKPADKGIYYGGPWEKPDKARIRALQIPFDVINLNDGQGLWELLYEANKRQTPIVLFNWTPNWVGAAYPGFFVEFPDYHPDCETRPEWGVNPRFLYDCGNPKRGWLKKVVSSNFPEKWPCIYQMLRRIDFTNSELEDLSALIHIKKMSYQQASDVWMKNHRKKWQAWIDDSCS